MTKNNKIFPQIRLHSEYSVLDGVPYVGDLVKFVVKKGGNCIGLTDFGGMGGFVELTNTCNHKNIKQILGTETVLTNTLEIEELQQKMSDLIEEEKKLKKDLENRKKTENEEIVKQALIQKEDEIKVIKGLLKEEKRLRSKIAFISYDWSGYGSLCAINNLSHKEGNVDGVGRVTKETIFKHKKGLFCIIDGLHGFLVKYIVTGKVKEAEELLLEFQKEFGEKLYVEFQPHLHRYVASTSKTIYDICKKNGINILINNAPKYISKEDELARKTMLCKKYAKSFSEIDMIEASIEGLLDCPYLSTYHIMERDELLEHSKKLFSSFMSIEEMESYIDNNFTIASRCEEYQLRCNVRLPKYEYCEDGMNEDEYLKKLAYESLEKYAERKVYVRDNVESYKELLEEEIEVITGLGFSGYFLVERDIVNYGKVHDFVGPGRGSAAGSLMTLLLGITSNIDPIQEDLLFERFLSFGRARGLEYHLMTIMNENGFQQPFIANKDLIGGGFDPAGKFSNVKSFEELFSIENFSEISKKESEKYILDVIGEGRITSGGQDTKKLIEQELKVLNASTPKDIVMFAEMHKRGIKAFNKTNSYIANELQIVTNYVEDPYEMQIFSTRDIPDIDVDFKQVEGEDIMYEYIKKRFGANRVERVGTYQKFQSLSLLRHFLSCMSVPPFRINQLVENFELKFDEIFAKDYSIRTWEEKEELVKEFMQIMKEANEELYEELKLKNNSFNAIYTLFNKTYSVGKHAGGIIISDISLDEYLPLMGTHKTSLGTGYSESAKFKDASYVGGVKFDVLKLKNLNIIESICKKVGIEKSSLYDIGPDEYRSKESEEMYAEIIGGGKYSGLFQIGDNDSAREVANIMLKEIHEAGKTITFNEISLMSAANRPASVKAELQDSFGNPIVGAHNLFNKIKTGGIKEEFFGSKVFEEVTQKSAGLVLYEEQTMIIAQKLCGYTELESSDLRKNFKKLRNLKGKDYEEYHAKVYNKFLEGAKSDKYEVFVNGKRYVGSHKRLDSIEQKKKITLQPRVLFEKGISDEQGRKLTNLVFGFSAYGFNKAHADSYALITHWTCLLKYKYPVSFMSVLLDSNGINNNTIKDLEQAGITLVAPDINISEGEMTPSEEEKTIYWGLNSIKGAGSSCGFLKEAIKKFGKIKSISEIEIFVEKRKFGKRAVEPLIKVGAFKTIEDNRKKLLEFYLGGGVMGNLHYLKATYKSYIEDFEKISSKAMAKKVQRLLEKYEFNVLNFYKDFFSKELKGKKIDDLKISTDFISYVLENEIELTNEQKRIVKLIELKKDFFDIEKSRYEMKMRFQKEFEEHFGVNLDEFKLPVLTESIKRDFNLDTEEVLKFKKELRVLRLLEKEILKKMEIEDFSNKEKREMENTITEGTSFTPKILTEEQRNLCKFILENKDNGYAGGEITKIREHIDKRGGLMAWIDFEVDCDGRKDLFNGVVCFASDYSVIKEEIELGNYICFKYDNGNLRVGRKLVTSSDPMFKTQEIDEGEVSSETQNFYLTKEEITEEAKEKFNLLQEKAKKEKQEVYFCKVNDVKKMRQAGSVKKIAIIEIFITKDLEKFDRKEVFVEADKINTLGKKFSVGKVGVIIGNSKFSVKVRKTYFIPTNFFNFTKEE